METDEETIARLEAELAAAQRSHKFWRGAVLFPTQLVVLFLILGTVVMNFVRARSSPQIVACYSNLKNIGTAMEMYSTDWSGKYPTSLEVLVPNYLKTIPECPAAGSVTYRAQFNQGRQWNYADFQDYYVVWCDGEIHAYQDVPDGFPFYDGIRGIIRNPEELEEGR